MDEVEDYRRRLAALSADRMRAPSPAAVQAAQSRLRQLKRDVLARVTGLRTEVQEQAQAPRKGRLTMGEAWGRRREGARKLLGDARRRVTGKVDREHGEAIEALTRINEDIDARLKDLEELVSRLDRRVGGDALPEARRRRADDEGEDDDLYAAVGAAVQQGEARDAYCPHCGKGLEPDDRFCRRCGHRLAVKGE